MFLITYPYQRARVLGRARIESYKMFLITWVVSKSHSWNYFLFFIKVNGYSPSLGTWRYCNEAVWLRHRPHLRWLGQPHMITKLLGRYPFIDKAVMYGKGILWSTRVSLLTGDPNILELSPLICSESALVEFQVFTSRLSQRRLSGTDIKCGVINFWCVNFLRDHVRWHCECS